MESFILDIETVKNFLLTQKSSINNLSRGLTETGAERDILEGLLRHIGLKTNSETLYTAYSRIVHLREDGLVGWIEKAGWSNEKQSEILQKAYDFVVDFYTKKQENILHFIKEKELLTPFYRRIIRGVHEIGQGFDALYPTWRTRITTINKELLDKYGSQEAVKKYLKGNHLLDTRHPGEIGDRSYSVLVGEGDTYTRKTYRNAFPREIGQILSSLETLREDITHEEDEFFGHKEIFLTYFSGLSDALSETNPDSAIEAWARVDTAWMQIKTPLQIAHPFEWYEDRFRDAVSPEWDLRLQDTSLFTSEIQSKVRNMFLSLSERLGITEEREVFRYSLSSLDRVQLYISHPFLYYGSFFTGLFSAQVLPNDNIVSLAEGKKIFSFAANRLEEERAKPKMQLTQKMVDADLLGKNATILTDDALFYAVYDVSTIGHEYGHTLWLESDTEVRMNGSGNFKNIEEWKATMGGLMAFFMNEKEELRESVLVEHIIRSVKVMAWREVTERVPYYSECLIHLHLLFASGIVGVNDEGKIEMHFSEETYEKFKKLCFEAYEKLAKTYIAKDDAMNFLSNFVVRENGVFLPKDPTVRAFVESYYKAYREIGNAVVSD